MGKNYLITSERLGMRNWETADLPLFSDMCGDPEVMKYFPKTLSYVETKDLYDKLKGQFNENGYTYFALDLLATGEFLGFTGFAHQSWKSEFTPCVDMGWRLKRSAWGNGYATEAARACLDNASKFIDVKQVLAFSTENNLGSQQVMKKIGMTQIGKVKHPMLQDDPRFNYCVVYSKPV